MTKKQLIDYIESHTIRLEAGYRGGGIEISLADLLNQGKTDKYDDYCLTAYQNYLGGGMLGKVCNDCNFSVEDLPKTKQKIVYEIAEELKMYFHNLTNHDDEWENESYLQNQNKPVSAY